MAPFLIGFLTCWVLIGIFSLVSDVLEFTYSDAFLWIIAFPILIVIMPICTAFLLLWRPWRSVWKPTTQERFETLCNQNGVRKVKIVDRFYVCIDVKAKAIFNKIFFVRIQRSDK